MQKHKIYLIEDEILVDYWVIPKNANCIIDSNIYIYGEEGLAPFLLGFYENKYVDLFGLFFDIYYHDLSLFTTSHNRIYIEKLIEKGERISEFSNPYYGYETYKIAIEGYVFYMEVKILPSQFDIDNPWLMVEPDIEETYAILAISAMLFTTYEAAKHSFYMHDFQGYKKKIGINN
jgi:hypothetical protein